MTDTPEEASSAEPTDAGSPLIEHNRCHECGAFCEEPLCEQCRASQETAQSAPEAAAPAPPVRGQATKIAAVTSASTAAGAAAAVGYAVADAPPERRSGPTVFLLFLGGVWACACLAAIVTVVYQSSPMSQGALRQALAQLPLSSGYVPPGPVPVDTVVDAYMQPEEGYGILSVGQVRLAMQGSDRYAWGNYQINVNPAPESAGVDMNNSGPDFEFRLWCTGDSTHLRWNRLNVTFKQGKLLVQGRSYPVNGPTVTLFFDESGQFVEAIQGQ
ncbi:MAG: hypothetical protein KDD82_24585 [Planctomycetes bacterium]|nr:hypothetical protein [Planctomycetota bacterium]